VFSHGPTLQMDKREKLVRLVLFVSLVELVVLKQTN
jgi:hypothetical protein